MEESQPLMGGVPPRAWWVLPDLFTTVPTLAWGVWLVWLQLHPFGDQLALRFLIQTAFCVLLLGTLGLPLIAILVQGWILLRSRLGIRAKPALRRALACGLTLLAVASALFLTERPREWAWNSAQPELDELAERWKAGEQQVDPCWCGIYRVHFTEPFESGQLFLGVTGLRGGLTQALSGFPLRDENGHLEGAIRVRRWRDGWSLWERSETS